MEKQGHIYKMSSLINKSEKQSINSRLNSRRVLCFDSALSDIKNSREIAPKKSLNQGITRSANLGKQLMNLKKMTQSPYQMKNLAFATPLTAAMEMYNWLYDKVRKRNYYKGNGFDWDSIKMNSELGQFFRKVGEVTQKELLLNTVLKFTEIIVKEEFKNVSQICIKAHNEVRLTCFLH